MSCIQSAVLVLRTCDLNITGNISGIKADYNISPFTWKNINLRSLLGTMYDKYDLFNLCLSSISSGGVSITGNTYALSADPNDNNVMIMMSGLPFINNTYDTGTQRNTIYTTLGCYQFPSLTTTATVPINSTMQYTSSNNCNTFGKYQESVDITIRYNRIHDDMPVAHTELLNTRDFPHVQFMFNIYGIKKDEDNLNGSRMKTLGFHN